MHKITAFVAALVACSVAIPASVFAPIPNGGSLWAVLVAGSNTWGNYRHQADLCHAYQILHSHGVPDSQIIVFMYDDLAENVENPTKGTIINWPNGVDVYHGVLKDYTKDLVTPQNFLNVIKGNAAAMKGIGSGRVLQSGPNDRVFINFVDHGGPQIVAFPNDLLHASDLIAALKYMSNNKMFAQLTFYLEACESGSMFDQILPNNINIYATTASNPTTSSYACYYDPKRQTYLGDVYSVNWMENADASDLTTETLQQQFVAVKKETNTSEVCQYGDLTFTSEPVGDFLGGASTGKPFFNGKLPAITKADVVDSREVEVDIIARQIRAAVTDVERTRHIARLQKLLEERQRIDKMFEKVILAIDGSANLGKHLNATLVPTQHECVETAIRTIHSSCFNLAQHTYGLGKLKSIVSLCESHISTDKIVDGIKRTCRN